VAREEGTACTIGCNTGFDIGLRNFVELTYTYDNDSRVTAMSWTLLGNTVANLQYQYDADGRVLQKTGTFAQSQLPSPVTANMSPAKTFRSGLKPV
jgi:hypothetical protein